MRPTTGYCEHFENDTKNPENRFSQKYDIPQGTVSISRRVSKILILSFQVSHRITPTTGYCEHFENDTKNSLLFFVFYIKINVIFADMIRALKPLSYLFHNLLTNNDLIIIYERRIIFNGS